MVNVNSWAQQLWPLHCDRPIRASEYTDVTLRCWKALVSPTQMLVEATGSSMLLLCCNACTTEKTLTLPCNKRCLNVTASTWKHKCGISAARGKLWKEEDRQFGIIILSFIALLNYFFMNMWHIHGVCINDMYVKALQALMASVLHFFSQFVAPKQQKCTHFSPVQQIKLQQFLSSLISEIPHIKTMCFIFKNRHISVF